MSDDQLKRNTIHLIQARLEGDLPCGLQCVQLPTFNRFSVRHRRNRSEIRGKHAIADSQGLRFRSIREACRVSSAIWKRLKDVLFDANVHPRLSAGLVRLGTGMLLSRVIQSFVLTCTHRSLDVLTSNSGKSATSRHNDG